MHIKINRFFFLLCSGPFKGQNFTYTYTFAQTWPPRNKYQSRHKWLVHGLNINVVSHSNKEIPIVNCRPIRNTNKEGAVYKCRSPQPRQPEQNIDDVLQNNTQDEKVRQFLKHGSCFLSCGRMNSLADYHCLIMDLHERYDIWDMLRDKGINPGSTHKLLFLADQLPDAYYSFSLRGKEQSEALSAKKINVALLTGIHIRLNRNFEKIPYTQTKMTLQSKNIKGRTIFTNVNNNQTFYYPIDASDAEKYVTYYVWSRVKRQDVKFVDLVDNYARNDFHHEFLEFERQFEGTGSTIENS